MDTQNNADCPSNALRKYRKPFAMAFWKRPNTRSEQIGGCRGGGGGAGNGEESLTTKGQQVGRFQEIERVPVGNGGANTVLHTCQSP